MSPAVDVVERLVIQRKLRHGAHPVLQWCAANAVVTRDPRSFWPCRICDRLRAFFKSMSGRAQNWHKHSQPSRHRVSPQLEPPCAYSDKHKSGFSKAVKIFKPFKMLSIPGLIL